MKNLKKMSKWILKDELAIPGTIRNVLLKCGKATCACKSGKESDKHGPYFFWDRKVDGRLTSTSLPKEMLEQFKKWIKNREELEEIVTQIKIECESLAKKAIRRSTPSN